MLSLSLTAIYFLEQIWQSAEASETNLRNCVALPLPVNLIVFLKLCFRSSLIGVLNPHELYSCSDFTIYKMGKRFEIWDLFDKLTNVNRAKDVFFRSKSHTALAKELVSEFMRLIWVSFFAGLYDFCLLSVLSVDLRSINWFISLQGEICIIIDAGSSGSRVHIFQYTPSLAGGLPLVEERGKSFKNKLPLSSFATQPNLAGPSLDSIINYSEQQVWYCLQCSTVGLLREDKV